MFYALSENGDDFKKCCQEATGNFELTFNKQTDCKRNATDDNNQSDPDLKDFILHHIIRKYGKKYAEELEKYDRKFSLLREYEDRVRN
jgi:hypothetical protein